MVSLDRMGVNLVEQNFREMGIDRGRGSRSSAPHLMAREGRSSGRRRGVPFGIIAIAGSGVGGVSTASGHDRKFFA